MPSKGKLPPNRVGGFSSTLAFSSCALAIREKGEDGRPSRTLDTGGFDADA
jgi:hypothetical protein